jgi:hypothetical protein
MTETDLKNNFDKIQFAANEFLNNFGPEFTNTPQGHIVTDITGASCVAGSMLLRETVPNLFEYKPGTVLLSEVHDRQNMVLHFITGVALTLGVDFRETKLDRLKPKLKIKSGNNILKEYEPLRPPIELIQKLDSKLYEVCSKANLSKEFAPYIAVLTAAKLVSAGIKMGILNLKVGKELLFFYVVLGSKIVPQQFN